MQRFFTPKENISKKEIIINDARQVHHIKDVLRKRMEDLIEVFDEDNNVYECRIKSIEKNKIIAQIVKMNIATPGGKKVHITLACAIPKKFKFDYIVEKTTELGVDSIIPLITKRSIVRLKDKDIDKKLQRWRRIVIEAAKQSHSLNLPVIESPLDFSALAKKFSDFDCIFVPNLSCKERMIFPEALNMIKGKKRILLLIGPEGDFTPDELEKAIENKALMITLGRQVLRVETAAIVCTGLLSLCLTDI